MKSTQLLQKRASSTVKIKVGRKTIGVITNGRFEKRARASRHLLRVVPGWAINVDILETLEQEAVNEIWIREIESGFVYVASLDNFRENGVPVFYPGHGAQVCLPLTYWKTTRKSQV